MNGESIMYRNGGHLYRFDSRKNYLQEVFGIKEYDFLKKMVYGKDEKRRVDNGEGRRGSRKRFDPAGAGIY